MYREDDSSFDVLCPIMPVAHSTRKNLIEELDLYRSDDRYVSDEKNNLKRKVGSGTFTHTIYMLPALLECALTKNKVGFRFVVTLANQIFFSMEGSAGYERPAHYQLAQITSETKDFPKGYFYSQGHLALSMGRIYLNKMHQLVGIDWNSGGFHPKAKATIRGLAIILLCFPSKFLASEINFDVLDNYGGYVDTHKFTADELKEIVLAKFSGVETKDMIEKNSFNRVIFLKGTQPNESADSDVEDDVENHPPINEDYFSESGYDSPVEKNSYSSLVNSMKTVKTSSTVHSLSFSSPVKKKDHRQSPNRYSPYRERFFSTSSDPDTDRLSSPQFKQDSPPLTSRMENSKNRPLAFR